MKAKPWRAPWKSLLWALMQNLFTFPLTTASSCFRTRVSHRIRIASISHMQPIKCVIFIFWLLRVYSLILWPRYLWWLCPQFILHSMPQNNIPQRRKMWIQDVGLRLFIIGLYSSFLDTYLSSLLWFFVVSRAPISAQVWVISPDRKNKV